MRITTPRTVWRRLADTILVPMGFDPMRPVPDLLPIHETTAHGDGVAMSVIQTARHPALFRLQEHILRGAIRSVEIDLRYPSDRIRLARFARNFMKERKKA